MRKMIIIFKYIFMGIFTLLMFCLVLHIGMTIKYNGYWNMESNGICYKITGGIAKAYMVSDSTMTRIKKYDGIIVNSKLYCALGKLDLVIKDSPDGKQLILKDKGSQVDYTSNKMPKTFYEAKTVVTTSPKQKFLMFYETFKENYAFADLYNWDVDKEYETYRELITDETDDIQLFEYMCKMVSGLKDGHVVVALKEEEYQPHKYKPEWITNEKQLNAISKVLISNYIKDYTKVKDCPVRFGTLNDKIGYIILQAMGTEELDQAKRTKKELDKIIKGFKDKETIVIDLRFNCGGYDAASLMTCGYFTEKPYLAYQKQTYYKGEYTQLQDIYVYPNEVYYGGNIILLTSEYTISAAETFARAMIANPNNTIQILGETTAGFYSDAIPKIIPGGFEFAMSTERYYSSEGEALEGKGIEPDVIIPITIEDANNGIDAVLEYILEN